MKYVNIFLLSLFLLLGVLCLQDINAQESETNVAETNATATSDATVEATEEASPAAEKADSVEEAVETPTQVTTPSTYEYKSLEDVVVESTEEKQARVEREKKERRVLIEKLLMEIDEEDSYDNDEMLVKVKHKMTQQYINKFAVPPSWGFLLQVGGGAILSGGLYFVLTDNNRFSTKLMLGNGEVKIVKEQKLSDLATIYKEDEDDSDTMILFSKWQYDIWKFHWLSISGGANVAVAGLGETYGPLISIGPSVGAELHLLRHLNVLFEFAFYTCLDNGDVAPRVGFGLKF